MVIGDNLGIDEAAVSAVVEMTVRVTDDSGGNIDYEDTLTWESSGEQGVSGDPRLESETGSG